ncbi:MAG: TVP38/TMEM64 family protein [Deltaproteobacteria bacterium]|nr:TVP38/TMEM64 family protein [Deltaproteobacteria bacterium]
MKKAGKKKWWIVLFILVLVGIFQYFHLGRFLTLAYLQESRVRFAALYTKHPWTTLGGYMILYILVTALSLPGAVVMTLAGGGLFGLIAGTVVISIASTIGATLACMVARFLLRDWVEERFGDKLTAVNRGIEEEGAFYLFTMRLIPAFPFFMINLVMGLTKMPIKTFFWVSQIGMLPGTLVYVNAGKELAGITSLSGILSPGLWISFALLGLFPLLMKKGLVLLRTLKGRNTRA